MSYVDTMKAAANGQILLAELDLQFLEQHGYALVRAAVAISMPTMLLPPPIQDQAARMQWAAIQLVIPHLHDMLKDCRRSVEYLGDPDGLRAFAATLHGGTGTLAGDLMSIGEQVRPTSLPGYYHLEGEAKAAYTDVLEQQHEQFGRYDHPLEQLHDVLIDVAKNIEDYYVRMAVACVAAAKTVSDLVGAIAGAAAAETGVGVVVAAAEIAAAITDVLAALLAGLTTILDTQHANEEKLKQIDPPVKWPDVDPGIMS